MSSIRYRLFITLSIFFSSQLVYGGAAEVGSSLHQKYELAINEVPAEVIAEINKLHPDVTITGAEKELKHGNTYIDVEALEKNGNEIEFDMLLEEQGWEIAEIQRDLTFKQVPVAVQTEFKNRLPELTPARIIESDQGDGTVIYEFFTISKEKSEAKHEIKFLRGEAQLLENEWKH